MANTSRTMANRKRPPPGAHGRPAPNSSAGGGYPRPQQHQTAPSAAVVAGGIDALLAKYARHLPPGGTVTVRLVKGSSYSSADPIAARRAAVRAARSGNDSEGGATAAGAAKGFAAPLRFPRVAKFNETVMPPNFLGGSLKDGRMYEEEVPKAKDESDEDESTAYRLACADAHGGEGNHDSNNPSITDASKSNKKKKRRWRRNDPRPRRWVLQEKAEFFDRIRKRKQRGSQGGEDDEDVRGTSNQYHGVMESNTSKYVILSVAPTIAAATVTSAPSSHAAIEQISAQPVCGFHTFSQPYKIASLSMEEAEEAIENKRKVVTRYMMHGKLSALGNSSEAKAALASGVAKMGSGRAIGSRSLGPAPKAMSRARLLGKLAGGGNDDEDDVMGDVRFSSTSRGSSRARKELLSSLGDEGVTVDSDGVLGGANDSEFAGRRRFMRVAENKDDDLPKEGSKGAGAMEEGFYQRDVAAEYDALDYDANEQFDDDDVNIGEDEILDDGGGFGGEYESGDYDMLDSEEEEGSDAEEALSGMATSAGMKAMLAKARGDSPANASSDNNLGTDALDSSKKIYGSEYKARTETGGGEKQGIDKMLDAAKKTAEEMEKKKEEKKAAGSPEAGKAKPGIEKDKDGKRLITLEAVRREIWLNGGAITSKRLMRKFDVTSKNPDRQQLFRTVVTELCNLKKDADGSNKLVLKQHYSKV